MIPAITRVSVACLLTLILAGCQQAPPIREYTVVGQIVAVEPETARITIRHEDIEGFMPAMTMPFSVRDRALLDGRRPGDLVTATLQVQDMAGWISHIAVTGHAPLPAGPAEPDEALGIGDAVPDVTFLNQAGQAVSVGDFRGHPTVLTFIYTRCPFPDFCPAIDSRFVALQEAITANPALKGVRLLSISLDPEFDRPPVLQAHADKLGADPKVWQFVTGEADAILALGRRFGLDVRRTGSEAVDIEHNLRTVVIGADGRVVSMLTGTRWQASEVVEMLRGIAAS